MSLNNIPMICTHGVIMRVLRESSELRQYHLEKERQAILNGNSFRDTLQAFVENNGQSKDDVAVNNPPSNFVDHPSGSSVQL